MKYAFWIIILLGSLSSANAQTLKQLSILCGELRHLPDVTIAKKLKEMGYAPVNWLPGTYRKASITLSVIGNDHYKKFTAINLSIAKDNPSGSALLKEMLRMPAEISEKVSYYYFGNHIYAFHYPSQTNNNQEILLFDNFKYEIAVLSGIIQMLIPHLLPYHSILIDFLANRHDLPAFFSTPSNLLTSKLLQH